MSDHRDAVSPEIEKLFADANPLTEADLESFGRKNREILDRPSFKAGVIKDQFIHAILEALAFEGTSQSELARRCGKSRQALSKQLDPDKPGNFTIDTMVELMHHVGRRVELHYPRGDEHTLVIHCLRDEPVGSEWDHEERKVTPLTDSFSAREEQPFVEIDEYEPSAA